MENSVIRQKYGVGRYLILFFILAFFGWLFESGFITLRIGRIYNSGFLSMPVCPIYAVAMLFAYLLLGTPDQPKGLLKRVENTPLRYTLYLLAGFIIPSAVELVVGNLFERGTGLTLWTYRGIPLSLKYVSAPVSLVWSTLLFFFMKKCFLPLKSKVEKIPRPAVTIVSIISILFLSVDVFLRISKLL